MDDLIPRAASEQLRELVETFRIVIVNGPRQARKTTLLHLYQRAYGGAYRSLDSAPTLATATADPESFARVGERPLIIDEVQHAGDRLVRAVKQVVDSERVPGQFILSGSTRFLTVPALSESLAGRAVFVDLWPLSLAERTGRAGSDFLDQVFTDPAGLLGPTSTWTRDDYLGLLCQGGYPEAVSIGSPRVRRTWFNGYIRTVTSRDVREFAHVVDPRTLTRLLALAAARSGGLLVWEDLARGLGIDYRSVRTYFSYLETVFLTAAVPAWSTNVTSRVTRMPKVFLADVGLAAHLLRVTTETLRQPGHPALGGLVETLVYTELLKARARTLDAFDISHLRGRRLLPRGAHLLARRSDPAAASICSVGPRASAVTQSVELPSVPTGSRGRLRSARGPARHWWPLAILRWVDEMPEVYGRNTQETPASVSCLR